jgi:YD repeat-containing protein
MKNFGIKSDRTLDFLVGDVKSVINKIFDVKNGVEVLIDHSIKEYNIAGYNTLSYFFNTNGRLRLKQVSLFSHDGNLIGFTNYSEADFIESYAKYEHDDEQRIISKTHNNQIEERYNYDSDGNISRVDYANSGGRDLYNYNKNGFVTEQLSVNAAHSLFDSLSNRPKRKLIKYTNDQFGNILKMEIFNADTDELIFTQTNSINEHGDETESIGYNSDGSIHSFTKFEYTYDNKNNWINQKCLSKEGDIYKLHERVITYHPISNESISLVNSEVNNNVWRCVKLNRYLNRIMETSIMKQTYFVPQKGELFIKDMILPKTWTAS